MSIKPGYLNKEGKWRHVRLMDLVTMLHNVHAGARLDDVGFEDAQESLGSLTARLTRQRVWVDSSNLESCLWSCNLMDEKQLFWDFKGRTLDEFLKQLIPGENFDRFFNVIETKEGSK